MAKSKPMLPISPESSLVNAEARQQKLDTRRGAKKLGKKAADEKRRTTPLLVPPRDAGSDDLPAPGIDLPGIHPVRIENIRPYQNNPRVEINPERDNIKAHIESELALGHPPAPLTVSRRPDSERQLVEVDAGGNTRLTLYQEIWAETKHPLLEKLFVVYREWTGEAQVLANHLGENTQHGAMSYWDLATGFMRLKRELERESGAQLTQREFVAKLPALGVPRSLAVVSFYEFAARNLSGLGEAAYGLSSKSVRQIQPRYRTFLALWKEHGHPEPDFQTAVFAPACKAYADTIGVTDEDFDAQQFLTVVEKHLAKGLGISVGKIRQGGEAPKTTPSAPLTKDPFPPPPPALAQEPATAADSSTPADSATQGRAGTSPDPHATSGAGLPTPPAPPEAPPPDAEAYITEPLTAEEFVAIPAGSTIELGEQQAPNVMEPLAEEYATWSVAKLRQYSAGYSQLIAMSTHLRPYWRPIDTGAGFEILPITEEPSGLQQAGWLLLNGITLSYGSEVGTDEIPILPLDSQRQLAGLTHFLRRINLSTLNTYCALILMVRTLKNRGALDTHGGAA